jgi:hypothetical protein
MCRPFAFAVEAIREPSVSRLLAHHDHMARLPQQLHDNSRMTWHAALGVGNRIGRHVHKSTWHRSRQADLQCARARQQDRETQSAGAASRISHLGAVPSASVFYDEFKFLDPGRIALMVVCCYRLAVRQSRPNPLLVRTTFDSCLPTRWKAYSGSGPPQVSPLPQSTSGGIS